MAVAPGGWGRVWVEAGGAPSSPVCLPLYVAQVFHNKKSFLKKIILYFKINFKINYLKKSAPSHMPFTLAIMKSSYVSPGRVLSCP